VQADVAADQRGGLAVAAGVAGEIFGASAFVRHAEYRGGFTDETVISSDLGRPPIRNTLLTADMSLPFFGGAAVPVSLRVLRDGFRDGGVAWTGTARASTSIAHTLVSTGFDYQREKRLDIRPVERLTGNLSLSRLVDFDWQLRAGADFDLLPRATLRAIGATVDRTVTERLTLRLGYGQTFGIARDSAVQASGVLRLPFADVSLTGDYATRHDDWRVALQVSFGALFDPGRRRYLVTPPGVASGATASLQAFVDADGDGRFGPGDKPAPNVVVEGGLGNAVTDAEGHALVTGLGVAPTAQVRVDITDVDSLYLVAPPATVEFEPRPGQVLSIPYPLQPAGEVYARVFVRRADGETGLSALRMQLVRDGRPALAATSEFDGSVVFSGVRPGIYQLEIDPEQAQRFHMRLREPVTLSVFADGALDVSAEVLFASIVP
jgi:hypothetical protein